MKFEAFMGAALAVVLSATAAQAGNVVANGDFATGDLTGWTVFTTANGTVRTPAVISFDVTGNGAQDAAEFTAGEVNFVPNAPAGGGLEQNITTGAGALTVSGDIAALDPHGYGNYEAGILNVLVDGSVVGSYDFGGLNPDQTLRDSFDFTTAVTSGSHDLQIEFLRPYTTLPGSTPYQFLTNVSATVAAVPEPATWAMLILGMGMIGATARRRREAGAMAA